MEPQIKNYRFYISSRKVTPGTHLNSDSSPYCNVTDIVDTLFKNQHLNSLTSLLFTKASLRDFLRHIHPPNKIFN